MFVKIKDYNLKIFFFLIFTIVVDESNTKKKKIECRMAKTLSLEYNPWTTKCPLS